MLEIQIPGFGDLSLKHLVMDFNGTMAVDGLRLEGVKELVEELSQIMEIHVLTADTFGQAVKQLEDLPLSLSIISKKDQDKAKLEYIDKLGATSCVCIGNGRNDALMLKKARIGIALIQKEGASVTALNSADIICRSVTDALKLFTEKGRLIATLRS